MRECALENVRISKYFFVSGEILIKGKIEVFNFV